MKILMLLLMLTNAISALGSVLVYDCIDLQNLNNDLNGTYSLMNDIDCRNSSLWNEGAGFVPIGADSPEGFCGTLNGQNYTIWHLEINRPMTDDVGLFSQLCTTSQIFNLQLHDCHIHANDFIGAIVAINDGDIQNVNVSGQVTGQSYIGGIVSLNRGFLCGLKFEGRVTGSTDSTHTAGIAAVNLYGQIIKALAQGIIKGNQNVGGIVSENHDVPITQVEFIGEVIASGEYTGGLVAFHFTGGTLTHGQVTGNITGTVGVGGIVGVNFGFTSSVSFLGNIVGLLPAINIGGLAGHNDHSATLLAGHMNGTIIGAHVVGGAVGGNLGRVEGIIIEATILTSLDSSRIGGLVGENSGIVVNNSFTGLVQGFLYVGGGVGINHGDVRSLQFSGSVAGHDAADRIGGLVGHNAGILTDAHAIGYVSGSYEVGGAVGISHSGEVTQVTFEGEVIGQNPGENIGGLIGTHELASLSHSFVRGKVTAYYRAGGAVGLNYGVIQNTQSYTTVVAEDRLTAGFIGENTGYVSDCTFFGNVSGKIIVAGFIAVNTAYGYVFDCSNSGYITGDTSVGGFIAQNAGFVMNCTTDATVSATSDRVAGIVADNQSTGTITDCFSNATISSERGDVGTIAGLNAGVVIRCQGYGTLTGHDRVGGLIGRQLSTGQLQQSYTNAAVHADFDRAGGAVGENAGLIDECASLSHVSGQDEVGSLIGRSTDITNHVFDSYAAGCVEAKTSKGGLTGSQADGVFKNIYWDTETTQQQDPAGKSGSFNLRSYGKTTRDLYHERTYENWKFGDNQTWYILEGHSYPYHQNLDLEKLPVAPESDCPRETTFFEVWIPRILFIISFIALGLWLETLGKYYRHRKSTENNLRMISKAYNVFLQSKDTLGSFKLEGPLVREAEVGVRGYISHLIPHKDELDSALVNAVLVGHYNVAVWLVSRGANPLMATKNNETAIHLVVIAGSRLTAYHLMNLSSDSTVWSCHFERTLQALHEDDCTVTEIDISAHAIDDAMFQRLIDAMLKKNTARTLNVSCNNITDLGVTYLSRHTSSLNVLETVNLSYNLLSDDGAWELKQKLAPRINVLLKGNELLSPNRHDWAMISTAPTGLLYHFTHRINQYIPLHWKLVFAKYQIIPTVGFFMGILGKVLDGLLILELNQTYQEDLTLISFIFFVTSSLLVGLLAIRVLYGTWLPDRLADILRWILFLPLLTPELVRLETHMGYIDSPLAMLKFVQFLLEDCPQFVISILFLQRKGFNLIALSRLCFSFIGSVSLFIHMLYNVPTLRNSLRQLKGSTKLLMTQLRLQET